MEVETLKSELHYKIEHADKQQLQELYGLIINYFDGQGEEEWDLLPDFQKAHILEGLEQADAGLGTPYHEVTAAIREKYGLDA